MTALKPGDRVSCKIKANLVIHNYETDFDDIKVFEIVAKDNFGYYLYIPHYLFVKDAIIADDKTCKQLSINIRFLNESILYISSNKINDVNYILDGLSCARCKEFYFLAAPNQEDGTLICWSCRDNPYR